MKDEAMERAMEKITKIAIKTREDTGINNMSVFNNAITPSVTPCEPPDGCTKNIMSFKDNKIEVTTFNHSIISGSYDIIPDITKVLCVDNKFCCKNDSFVVVVFFADGTKEKATLAAIDDMVTNTNMKMEMGISICITKKMLSMKTNGQGSSVYNKLIKHAFSVIKKDKERKALIEHQNDIIKQKKEKIEMKRTKRKYKKKMEEIEILSEAFTKALKTLKKTSFDF